MELIFVESDESFEIITQKMIRKLRQIGNYETRLDSKVLRGIRTNETNCECERRQRLIFMN